MDAHPAGLRVLLGELGVPTGRAQKWAAVALIATFEVSFVALAVAQAILEYALDVSPIATVLGVWIVWTIWHSWLFPRRRQRHLTRSRHPYRTAFVWDIYPWVTVGFCQMWRPLLNGDTLARTLAATPFVPTITPAALVGLGLGLVSLVVMISAIRTIGIGNAAFVPEFAGIDRFVPVRQGLYLWFAHPLFWAGILFSVGLALVAGTITAAWIAAINVAYGFVYNDLEHRRLARVFGDRYEQYVSQLPGVATRSATPIAPAGDPGLLARADQEVAGARAVEREGHEQ
jgi:protein-S-isoprenylcysteine O-methyltransferase Ste14